MLAAVALSVGLVGPAIASAATAGFTRAVTVSSPLDAAHDPNGWLYGVSCAAPGDCTSVGQYQDTAQHDQAMAAAETTEKWGRASEVSLPANAAKNPGAALRSVSCTSAGICGAVGSYTSSSGQRAMAASESSGKWGRATEVNPPVSPYSAALNGVSCTSTGNCVAVGNYAHTSSSGLDPMVATETAGTWARAVSLSLPANAASGSAEFALVYQVSCISKGNCTAVGMYSDTSNDRHAMVVTEASGTWGRAVAFDTLPTGAGGGWASFYAVSCSSAGNCAAGGAYEDDTSNSHAMAATETAGKWTKAVELSLPAGASGPYPNAELEGVSCTSAGNCAGFGVYSDTLSYSHDMVAIETAGRWARGAGVTAPTGSLGESTVSGGSGDGVACTKGSCTAVGSYGNSSGNSEAMAAAGTI